MSSLFLPPDRKPGQISYKDLSEHLKTLILRGDLQPGTQLPTVRRLATQLDVSPLTIQRAYNDLAESGLTNAQSGVGTFIAVPKPHDRERLSRLLEKGKFCTFGPALAQAGIRSMCMAFPDPELYDDSEVLAAFGDLIRRPIDGMMGSSPLGLPEMIRQASRLLAQHGFRSGGDEIVITHGEVDAICQLAKLLGARGPVLVPNPYSLMGRDVLAEQGVKSIAVRFDNFGLDLERLDKLASEHQPSAIMIASAYSSPTGAVLSDWEMAELVRLARRHDFMIIELGSDRWISFDDELPPTLLERAPERTFYIDYFSFSCGPGIRLGYVRCPSEWKPKLSRQATLSHLGPSNLLQAAVAVYLERGSFQRHLSRVVPKYRARRDALVQALGMEMPFAKVTKPRGGFSAWITMPEEVDCNALHPVAMEAGVSYTPGTLMTDSCDARNKLRLCYSLLTPEGIREAIRELSRVFKPRK